MTWNALVLIGLLVLSGCSSTQTFSTAVRAGDTVSHAVGMQTGITRDNLAITFIPAGGGPSVSYLPGDDAIHAVINLYPDPVSKILVGGGTDQGLGTFANIYNSSLENTLAGHSRDWWNTLVIFDVPLSLPMGTYSVEMISNGNALNSSVVEVIDGGGSPATFGTHEGGALLPEMLYSLERAENYSINFSGATVPYALQVDFIHDPDSTMGGIGKPYVVNPRGDVINVAWTSDGTSMRVIVTPAGQRMTRMEHFKFYVAGGIGGLVPQQIQAFDIDGGTVPGVQVSVAHNN